MTARLPGSKRWHRINPRTRTPTNSVWLGVTLAFLLGFLTFLQSGSYAVAFFAFVGITAVGLYIVYIIPVFLRLRSKTFVQGPWNLRGFSKLVGWTAVVYVVFINLMFLAPQFGPVSGASGRHGVGTSRGPRSRRSTTSTSPAR